MIHFELPTLRTDFKKKKKKNVIQNIKLRLSYNKFRRQDGNDQSFKSQHAGSKSLTDDKDDIRTPTFNSSKEKPLPALTFMLYFNVCPWTIGRRYPLVGRGKILTAFFWRAGNDLTDKSFKYHSTNLLCIYTIKVYQLRNIKGTKPKWDKIRNPPTLLLSFLAGWLNHVFT